MNILKNDLNILKIFSENNPNLDLNLNNLNNIDDKLIKDMVEKIVKKKITNLDEYINNNDNEKYINDNYELSDKHIYKMLENHNNLIINGRINNEPIKILFDTGATNNFIFKSKTYQYENIIDKKNIYETTGLHISKKTYGTIWYLEIELKTNKNNYEKFGINLQVIEDNNINNINNINFNSFDMILGLPFMMFYKANIDFETKIITLNNKIKINF